MAQILKLTGLVSYTNPVMGTVIMKKGETGRFPDAVADKMVTGVRGNTGEGEAIHYWTEMPEGSKYDYNFCPTAEPVADTGKKVVSEEAGDDAEIAAMVPPVKTRSQRK